MEPSEDTITYGFCHCGCGQQTKIATRANTSRGHVKGLPIRYVNGHNRRMVGSGYVLDERGFSSACWISRRAVSGNGYGKVRVGENHVALHVLNYVMKFGPVPNGLELDHLCRQRGCCNPDHLETVTHPVNVQRGALAKLTPRDVVEIRLLDKSVSNRLAGQMFGVGASQVSRIRNRKSWRDEVCLGD